MKSRPSRKIAPMTQCRLHVTGDGLLLEIAGKVLGLAHPDPEVVLVGDAAATREKDGAGVTVRSGTHALLLQGESWHTVRLMGETWRDHTDVRLPMGLVLDVLLADDDIWVWETPGGVEFLDLSPRTLGRE